MTFQTPITIAEAVHRIQAQDLVLPAIQREFVWEEEQITRLFDSILRGYPIGSNLSWKVQPETAAQFKFYGFMREYHQKDNRYCPVLDIPRERTVIALLDGQQRLTALNIGERQQAGQGPVKVGPLHDDNQRIEELPRPECPARPANLG